MTDEPITWDNIEGLTDNERRLYKTMLSTNDLRGTTLRGNRVNGVLLPDVVNGKVQRK